MKKLVAICDTLIVLALVAWVGGHAALGAFAARIVFRDLPRPLAASTMSTIFSSFDNVIGVMAALLLAAVVTRVMVQRERRADQERASRSPLGSEPQTGSDSPRSARLADWIICIAGIFLACLGMFEVFYVNRQILEMFQAGRTLEPSFRSMHHLSERCGHLEVALTAIIAGAQAWSRL
jgi:hypothetical protein